MISLKNKIYKKCLLIGGAGFIGLQTAKLLKKEGYEVAIVDNFSTSVKDKECKDFDFYEIDASSIDILEQAYANFLPDVVYIFSSIVDVPSTIKNPLIVKPGILSLVNSCELSKKYNTKLNIYASSGYVYGNQNKLPYKENDFLDPVNPYNISKIFGESFANFYSNQYQLPTIIMRYAPTYGPRRNIGPIYDFIRKSFSQEKISLFGEVTRDYIYVEDVALANLLVLNHNHKKNEIYNIGTSEEVSLEYVYQLICENQNIDMLPILRFESNNNEINRFALNISKAQKELNFHPKFSLKAGLMKTIQWMKIYD